MLVGRADGELGHALTQDNFGFSITHAFKRVGHGITSVGKEAGHLAVKGVKLNLKLLTLPTMELEKHVLAPILHTVLTPVRHKVDTLKSRRAHKLAWDRRQSLIPTPQENAEAKKWAKSYLKKEVPPFGLMLSLLAGPSPMALGGFGSPSGGSFGDPTTATIIASVPTLLAIINKVLTRSSKNGEAPAHSGRGGGGKGGGAPGAGAGAGGDAAGGDDASAADTGADGGGGGGGGGKHGKHGGHGGKGGGGGDGNGDDSSGGGGGHGGKMVLPGIGAVPKTAVYVGGGILALVLIVALTKKSG